jgi:hypothetical protein
MTYALSEALQKAVYTTLINAAPVTSLVSGAIYDASPDGAFPGLYVSLGPEEVRARNDMTGRGAEHRFTVNVVSDADGFLVAKEVAGAICETLQDATPPLERGRVVSLNFDRARARRIGPDERRQIELRFHARVEDY